MHFGIPLAILLVFVLTVTWQIRSLSQRRHALLFAFSAIILLGGVWSALEWAHRREPLQSSPTAPATNSQTCCKCHEGHYNSWHKTYHRTMTQEARPENIKGTFDGAPYTHLGVTTRMLREGDKFFMEFEFLDPARRMPGVPLSPDGTSPRLKYPIDRLVGSHWIQQMLHREEEGRYVRLPMAYHIVEKRWVHMNGVFLDPDRDDFFGRLSLWNKTCVYCHNTRPSANPYPVPGQMEGFRTTLGELGISCEACHGAGERHVRAHMNPAKRLAQRHANEADPTIVNPARLSVERSVDICAHCHGATVPRHKEWNTRTFADPYLAGQDLKRFWFVPFSQLDFNTFKQDAAPCCDYPGPTSPPQRDVRFWSDGTPHSTATEYQGLAMSACYERGHGKMTCLTCHSMHNSDPNHQVKKGMRTTNAVCYSCHADYRTKLSEHTHHAADSQGSLCYNCHMPHQVYGLLSAHRSHRISIPRVRETLISGKPHACNLCHLDKSIGWTQEQLGKWYGTKPESLSADELGYASSLLNLTQSDARTRAVFAEAFSWPPAQQASGRDWSAQLLTRVLEHERYQAVRYSAYKSLLSLHGALVNGYEYQAPLGTRAIQLRDLRSRLEGTARPDRSRYPYLPLTAAGVLSDETLDRLLKARKDPDVSIHE